MVGPTRRTPIQVYGRGDLTPLLPPGICLICEQRPKLEDELILDTTRNIHVDFPFHLAGRKYVCEPCAVELGTAVGLVSGDELQETLEQALTLADRVASLEEENEALRQLHNLADRFAPAPKPKAKAKSDA